MFFLLSKILAFAISPITWLVVLMGWAIAAKNAKRRKRVLIASFLFLYIFSNRVLINEVILLWETPIDRISPTKQYDFAIIAGGYSHYDPKWERVEFLSSADRLFIPLQLYKAKKVKKLLLTGGTGSLENKTHKEAIGISIFLQKFGIPKEDVLIEPNSRNTYENAIFTKDLIDSLQLNNKRFLLVTSGIHMKRTMGCFKKAGVHFIPYSVDGYAADRHYNFEEIFVPSADAFASWYWIFHEIIGYLSYSFMGYL